MTADRESRSMRELEARAAADVDYSDRELLTGRELLALLRARHPEPPGWRKDGDEA